LRDGTLGLGAVALSGLMGCSANTTNTKNALHAGLTKATHLAPKAKRVIFLHMAGAPSQLELFDYKPILQE